MKMVVWTEYPLAQLGFSKNFLALGTNGCCQYTLTGVLVQSYIVRRKRPMSE